MFKNRLGENLNYEQKNKFKARTFSLIPTKLELQGRDAKLEKFKDKYIIPIAKELYSQENPALPMEEADFLNVVTNLNSFHVIREMSWVYQFLMNQPERLWNAIQVSFQIFELGMETSPDSSEPMNPSELSERFKYGLTTVGPHFTMEEKKNYFESTGNKLNYLCPLFVLRLVNLTIKSAPIKETTAFFDALAAKVMDKMDKYQKKQAFFKNKKKTEDKATSHKISQPKPETSESETPKTFKKKPWWKNKKKHQNLNEDSCEGNAVESNPVKELESVTDSDEPTLGQIVSKAMNSKQEVHVIQTESPEVPKDEVKAEPDVHYAPTEAELTEEQIKLGKLNP